MSTKHSSSFQKAVSTLVLGVFALQVTGCESLFKFDPARSGLKSLISLLESQESSKKPSEELATARALLEAARTADTLLDDELVFEEKAPTEPEGAREFVKSQQARIATYLKRLEDGSTEMRKLIYNASRRTYEVEDTASQARFEAIVYYGLEAQRLYHRRAAEILSPYMLYTSIETLRDIPEVSALNAEISKSYFRHFGAQMVSHKDARTTLEALRELKNARQLPEGIEANINRTLELKAGASGAAAQADPQSTLKSVMQKLTPAQQKDIKDSIQKLSAEFDNVSFLYDPDNHLNPVLGLLVIIGNLTWGLCNTLIGAGIVIWAAALSVTGLCRFPRFAIAQNGYMIYVDVTGSNPLGIYGKMSMGLFELDNGTGYSFASRHEGIHSIQSAVLGPLYLPTILFSYMISGFDQGFMEDMADQLSYL